MEENKVLKVFISQPMRGKTDKEIVIERAEIIAYIIWWVNHRYKGEATDWEQIGSFFEGEADNKGEVPNPVKYLARSIDKLAEADLCMFAPGWEKARGCRIERIIAAEYDKGVLYLCRDENGELAEASVEPYTSESDADEGEKCALELLERIGQYVFGRLPDLYDRYVSEKYGRQISFEALAAATELENIAKLFGFLFETQYSKNQGPMESVSVNGKEFWRREDAT